MRNNLSCSKLNLKEIIKRVLKNDLSFNELKSQEKSAVLKFIKVHNLKIKVFKEKYYDILKNKFYVSTYRIDDDYNNIFESYRIEKKEFDNFDDFYIYVAGDIYSNSCFFGYVFTEDEISKYKIDLDKINFDSFIFEKIDQFTFENIYFGKNEYKRRNKKLNGFRKYQDTIEIYEEESNFTRTKKIGYDNLKYAYYIYDKWENSEGNIPVVEQINCFFEFNDLIKFLNGNSKRTTSLDACLRKELKKIEMKRKIDDFIKLPKSNQFNRYTIQKMFINNKFIVSQTWFDDDFLIAKDEHQFKYFFDFVYFLNNDLSNADLIMCDGVENLKGKNIKLEGIKARSEVLETLEIKYDKNFNVNLESKEFNQTINNELNTINNFSIKRVENGEYQENISYVTDIHLLHRFDAYNCQTIEDAIYVMRHIAKELCETATSVNLIGGDIASDFNAFCSFIREIRNYRKFGDFFFTLGNHELWNFNQYSLENIFEKYKKNLNIEGSKNFHLLQNNLFYLDGNCWMEISEDELNKITKEDLRNKTRKAKIIVFGGLGFAGKNDIFNANFGIYKGTVSRVQEQKESEKFLTLYEKITNILFDKNLVILTHMPMCDWGGNEIHAKEGIVYVNGHNHHNYYFDDGKKRIYADNQIGYRGKEVNFKKIPIDYSYDWFADYKDGIYEISKDDYLNFYRGICEHVSFKRFYLKLYMIKKLNNYMFFMKNTSGNLVILNGGLIKGVGKHTLQYYFDNLENYSKSINLYLSSYGEFQKKVSQEIKKIGGNGCIHGAIVDIDFYNHLYLNPLDYSITPYFAYDMVEKYVYENLPSLLKDKCSGLYTNYEKLLNNIDNENELVLYDKDYQITKNKIRVTDKTIYKFSRIIRGLQYTTKHNVVRLWSDDIASQASDKNGLLIVSKLLSDKQ